MKTEDWASNIRKLEERIAKDPQQGTELLRTIPLQYVMYHARDRGYQPDPANPNPRPDSVLKPSTFNDLKSLEWEDWMETLISLKKRRKRGGGTPARRVRFRNQQNAGDADASGAQAQGALPRSQSFFSQAQVMRVAPRVMELLDEAATAEGLNVQGYRDGKCSESDLEWWTETRKKLALAAEDVQVRSVQQSNPIETFEDDEGLFTAHGERKMLGVLRSARHEQIERYRGPDARHTKRTTLKHWKKQNRAYRARLRHIRGVMDQVLSNRSDRQSRKSPNQVTTKGTSHF